MLEKVCNSCKNSKPVKEFHKQKECKDGLRGSCRSCRSTRFFGPNRQSYLKRKYGINNEDYERLFKEQEGKCTICHSGPRHYRGEFDRLCVDHCHKTGIVRGLLCQSCNLGLGAFKDNIMKLEKAIKYLMAVG